MLIILWSLFQQHIDTWSYTLLTVFPPFGILFCIFYPKTGFDDVKRKEQRDLETMKQQLQLLESKALEESIQIYERLVLKDAHKMLMLRAILEKLETFTQE